MNEERGEKPNVNSKNEKRCSKCRQVKPLSEFHRRSGRPCGVQSQCKNCKHNVETSESRKTYHEKYRKNHKGTIIAYRQKRAETHKQIDAQSQRVWYYKTYFNLTLEELQKIIDYQNGCCAMCGRPVPIRPNLDHRHADGLIRGILCWLCNRLLGMAHDNPELFKQGIAYLADPPAVRALGTPHYGLPGRIGTKAQRKLAKKLTKQQKMLDKNSVL